MSTLQWSPPASTLPEMITLREASERLGVCGRTVHRLADDGQIGRHRLPGGPARFVRADVERVAAEAFVPARETVTAS